MKIDRIIVSSNTDESYIKFWEPVSKAWYELLGIRPTLFVISNFNLGLSEKYGDVYYQEPNIKFSTIPQSQIIRFFGATNFPNEVCLLSDLDMMPLQAEYYIKSIESVPKENIVFYSSDAYIFGNPAFPAFPMCYMAALGSTFSEIMGAKLENFNIEIEKWLSKNYGWYTDEKVFYEKWEEWGGKKDNSTFLQRGFNRGAPKTIKRIDRSNNSHYDEKLLKDGFYIDYHMPRPYGEYKETIDKIYDSLPK